MNFSTGICELSSICRRDIVCWAKSDVILCRWVMISSSEITCTRVNDQLDKIHTGQNEQNQVRHIGRIWIATLGIVLVKSCHLVYVGVSGDDNRQEFGCRKEDKHSAP